MGQDLFVLAVVAADKGATLATMMSPIPKCKILQNAMRKSQQNERT
jgi:hypothetical protein